jgi:Tol biopolymer transport system component
MGVVYRATDERLGRDVAIKVLPDTLALDRDRMARFEREARTLASLNHPNIAQLYGVEQGALVMELVEGERLRGPLPVETAVNYGLQIADALEHAHEKGVIHRDLKPGNIRITPDGKVKVLDFGLAKAMEGVTTPAATNPEDSPTLTVPLSSAGVILGTAAYMSPEQARGDDVDKRADIWAFGCVLFEMLTGRRAFAGVSITDVLASVMKDAPDWTALPNDTPPAIRRLLVRCLEKHPRRRLHDIADARIEIDDALEPLSDETANARSHASRFGSSRHAGIAWTLAAVLGLLAASLAAVLLLTPTPSAIATRLSIVHRGAGGFYGAPQISPDGTRIVYSAEGSDGLFRLWVRDIDAFEPKVLQGTESWRPSHHPFWAPDSQSIGFFADGKLKRVSSIGGGLQSLAEIDGPNGGSWSKGNVILYGPDDASGLFRIPADGTGKPQPATTPPGDAPWSHAWPAFLPDGRQFLFVARAWNRAFDASDSGIFLGSLDRVETRRLLPDVSSAVYVEPGYLLFVRDGQLSAVAFDASTGQVTGDPIHLGEQVTIDSVYRNAALSVSNTGVVALRQAVPFEDLLQAQWFDRHGTMIRKVGEAMAGTTSASLGRDGRRVALGITDVRTANSDIVVMDDDGANVTRFAATAEWEGWPVWSRDGRRIAYTSTSPSGGIRLVVQDLEGRNTTLLEVSGQEFVHPLSWSPGDAHLLFRYSAGWGGQDDLHVWSFATQKATPYIFSTANEFFGSFSPDGRWVVYASNGEAFVARFPTPGEPIRLATDAFPISWRDDGAEILVMTPRQDVVSIPVTATKAGVTPGPRTVLIAGPTDFGPRVLPTRDHSRLYAAVRPDPEQGAREIRLVSGLIETLRSGRLGGTRR